MRKTTAPDGRRKGPAVAVAMLLAAAVPAAAVERGAYIALDYGKFRFDRKMAEFNTRLDNSLECDIPYLINPANFICDPRGDVSIGTSAMGRKTRGYGLWVGYQFNRWFAVEGAYLEMGRTRHVFSGTFEMGDVNNDGNDDGQLALEGRNSFRTRGAAIAAVGNLELGEYFSLDARAGFFFADTRVGINATVSLPDGPQQVRYGFSRDRTSLFYGASANFWITPYVSLRAGVAAYDNGFYGGEVEQYFIGIRYSYGY